MKSDAKKYLIYIRYLLPIFALLITAVMLFVPSFRFVFQGKVGERMSVATLISNSWEQAREVLFGAIDKTDAAIIFSRTMLILIIVLVILFLLSVCVSVWSAIVAFKCFLSDDEEGAERSRRLFTVLVPNRIALCVFSSLGLSLTAMPYFMKPIYAFTYSQKVTAVLEAPDALIVGGVLMLAACVLSIICAPIEKAFEADIFYKKSDESENDADIDSEYNEDNVGYRELDSAAKENIRRLFDGDGRSNKDGK